MGLKDLGEGPARSRARPPADIERLLPLYNTGGVAFFGYRMVLAAKLFDRRITRVLKEHGALTLPQWRVLAQLGLRPTATVRSLAEGAAVDRAEVSRVVRELADRGLIERRDNKGDLRSPDFSITPEGRALFLEVRKPISSVIKHMVEDVPAADLEAADRVLWAVTRGSIADGL